MEDVVQSLTGDLRIALLAIGALLLLVIVIWEIVQRRRAARADAAHVRGPLGQAPGARDDDLSRADPLISSVHRQSAPSADTHEADDRPAESSQSDGRREPTLTLPEITPMRDRLVEPPLVDLESARVAPGLGPQIPVLANPEASAPALEAQRPSSLSAASDKTAPDEDRRIIVALRVVARGGERFTGASLRQALQGEGFAHGEMSIFHRTVAEGQTLMSAASLTKPGNFDLATMDSSRFLGINLFAVLPGPLPGRDTVDKLLLAGHTLAQRLRGDLLDSKGQPLTEARLAEMRREAAAGAP